jgi:hypothetical protein
MKQLSLPREGRAQKAEAIDKAKWEVGEMDKGATWLT